MSGITYSLITYSTIPFQMTPNSKLYHSYNKCRLRYQTIRLHIFFNMWKIPRTLLAFILKFFSIAFCMLPAVSNHAPFLFSSSSSITLYHLIGFQFPHFPPRYLPLSRLWCIFSFICRLVPMQAIFHCFIFTS